MHASLGFLLEHRPPGLRLVLASRSDPPLALARLRARGQLTELRAAELRFTAGRGGGAAARGGRPAVALPDAAVAALAARTEGWAAGLQLAALVAARAARRRRVRGRVHRQPPLRPGLPGRGGARARSPSRCATFLLETSVLERLSGPLCDAVTGRDGSQALLEQVERAGLFLVPLDEVRGWWRYHHLFADLLRARLQQSSPARRRRLHRNAAAWYARARAGRRRDPPRGGRRGDALGRPADRAALRRRSSTCAAKGRRSSGGCRRCPPTWSGPAPGCCWRRRRWRTPAADLEAVEPLLDAAERAIGARPTRSRSSRPSAGPAACW